MKSKDIFSTLGLKKRSLDPWKLIIVQSNLSIISCSYKLLFAPHYINILQFSNLLGLDLSTNHINRFTCNASTPQI